MSLDEARESAGRVVHYSPYPGAEVEMGKITEVRGSNVFVLYRGDLSTKATRAEDLSF